MRAGGIGGLLGMVVGCAGGGPSGADDPPSAAVDRGPTTIPLDADPNGLWWDPASATLYLADDDGNRILAWTDAAGVSVVGTLPAPDDLGLGQVVLADGRLFVTRFGYGTAGDIAWVAADGSESGVVPNLDPERRRIGLGVSSDGQMFDAWFVASEAGQAGAVSFVDPVAGGEISLLSGLVKPVGVLEADGRVFVSEQANGEVLSVPLAGGDPAVVAVMDAPDLLAAGPDGSLFTGSRDGGAWQIGADGEISLFVTGAPESRGVAYDAENGRLFYAHHDPDDTDGLDHTLEIVPVP